MKTKLGGNDFNRNLYIGLTLYTYIMDDIYPTWKKRSLIPTLSANRELLELNMDLYDVLKILEDGFDCSELKRKVGVIERCIKKKKKILKVVVIEDEWRWSGEKVWAITHVGVL